METLETKINILNDENYKKSRDLEFYKNQTLEKEIVISEWMTKHNRIAEEIRKYKEKISNIESDLSKVNLKRN